MTLILKTLRVSILFAEAILTKMDKEHKSYMKVCYKKFELLSHSVFGNLQIFWINAKGFGSEEKVLCGRDIRRFWEEMGWEFVGYGIEMSGFIIRRTL